MDGHHPVGGFSPPDGIADLNLARAAGKITRGLSALGRRSAPAVPDSLSAHLNTALATLPCPATILLATGDRTAQAFVENCDPGAVPVERLVSASHSFAGDDGEWLVARVLAIMHPTL